MPRIFEVMLAIHHLLAMFVADRFKLRRWLEAENLFLRYQLNIALRRASPRLRSAASDRLRQFLHATLEGHPRLPAKFCSQPR